MKRIIILTVGLVGLTGSANMGKALAQKFLPAASDMLTFTTISQKLHEMDVDADVAWTKLADRAAYDAYRKSVHAKMMAAMGEWPARTPLNARRDRESLRAGVSRVQGALSGNRDELRPFRRG